MSDLRWAVMGTGRIAVGVAPRLAQSEGCEVVCFASRDRDRALAAARKSGLVEDSASAGCTYDDLLVNDDVEAVYLTLINSLHTPWCIKLLDAGKHVLCEKPLCATEAEAKRIAEAAERSQRLCMEGFMPLHHPQSTRLRKIAQDPDGPIGTLKAIRSFRDVRMTDEYILNTRLSHAMQGGALMDVGCYPVSMARFLAGSEPGADLEASAKLSEPRPSETDGVDMTSRFSWTFENGVTFEGGCSFASEHRVFLELIGDRGRAYAEYPFSPDLADATPLLVNDQPEVWNDRGDKFVHQFERFARADRGEEPPLLSMDWSIGQARTIERIHREIGVRFNVDS